MKFFANYEAGAVIREDAMANDMLSALKVSKRLLLAKIAVLPGAFLLMVSLID